MSVELESPVPVHKAANNAEAQLIAVLLTESGIPAYAVDDVSTVGYFALGTLPALLRPMVYVDKSRLTEARELLAAHREGNIKSVSAGFCHYCGAPWPEGAPAPQYCPDCGGTLSVESEASPESDMPYASRSRRVFLTMRRGLAILALLPFVYYFAVILTDVIRRWAGR